MNKPLVFLALSLVANAGLLAYWWQRPEPAAVRGPSAAGGALPARSSPAAPSASRPEASAGVTPLSSPPAAAAWNAQLRAAIAAGDQAAVRRLMAATGLPEVAARALLRALIQEPYLQRRHQLYAAKLAEGKPFWQRPLGDGLTTAERAELRQLQRTANERSRQLAGPDELQNLNDQRRYDFLPAAKAAQLRDLERDYAEMQVDLSQETTRFRVPEDEKRAGLLRAERERDLAALLTPEERALHELNNSPTAQNLRNQLAYFHPTEEEFKKVFALQKAFDEKYLLPMLGGAGASTADAYRERSRAEEQLRADLRRELGEVRYADYERNQAQDYRQLQAAGQRFQLPATALDQAWAARAQLLSVSEQVVRDPALPAADRQRTLAAAAVQARAGILAALGPTVGPAYLQNALTWLPMIEKGQPLTAAQANSPGTIITTVQSASGGTVTMIRTVGPTTATPTTSTPTPEASAKKGTN